jgi:hypothetical protein
MTNITMKKELQRTFSKEYTSIIKQLLKDGNVDRYLAEEYLVEDPNSCIYRLQGVEHNYVELDADKSDYENAVAFYEANRGIPPFIAAEEAFWAYLTHIEYFDFVKKRWNINSTTTKETIMKRFFYSGSNMDNTLSRLWWAVYLTVDESLEDKYKYTRVLLQDGNSDLLQNLSKSKLFRHKEAVIGMLKFFSEYNERSEFSKVNRFIIQRFNRIGGVRQLVYMDRDYFYNESKISLEEFQSIK